MQCAFWHSMAWHVTGLKASRGGKGKRMASELDVALKAAMERLIAPGAPLELVTVERDGMDYRAFRNAPPSLAA